jgi:hypothetical protein
MDRMKFPVFYARAEFYDVGGVLVSLGNCESDEVPACAAWDVLPPRKFDPVAARGSGVAISHIRFNERLTKAFPEL